MSEAVRIRYTDIIRTFSTILMEKFDLDVYDVIEDFPRACFMTDLEIKTSERYMTKHIDDDMTMTIYYFPSDPENNTAELAIMREDLRDLFLIELDSLIPVHKKVSLEIINEISAAVVDNVLQFKIDLSMSHRITNFVFENDKKMEELDIDTVINNSTGLWKM